MTKRYELVMVINENYENPERKIYYENEFDDFWRELMNYQADFILKEKGLKLDKNFKNPYAFVKVTKMEKGTEDVPEEISYITYLHLKKIK